jgi:hypothetical protein
MSYARNWANLIRSTEEIDVLEKEARELAQKK